MVKKKVALISKKERMSLVDKRDSHISVSEQCRLLSLNRTSLYYSPSGKNEIELAIMKALDALYLEDPTRGTRRMSIELRKQGFSVGRIRTRSLMQRMRLKTIYCVPRTTCMCDAAYKYPYLLRNVEITHSNHAWAADITYIPMAKGYLYLFAIIDLKSRFILNWSLSNTMEASWVVATMKDAVKKYGKPEIINTDQGSQFTSSEWVDYIKGLKKTKISMDGKGRAIDNVFIERFWRTLKYEKLYLQTIENGMHANQLCREFMEYYNYRRSHSSIGDQTPAECYQKNNPGLGPKVISGIFHRALNGSEKFQNNFPLQLINNLTLQISCQNN